ncbi:MAG: LLM class flavin-dependent oxidoreductase [Acidimicrobiia bacterium]|nr:LLM class flavin-dependent oxidoreductase [Acidimicrobiia bacterium]
MKLHWFLPTGGDARDVLPAVDKPGQRPPAREYLAQVALAAEANGFEAMLTPCGTGCEDAWITTASLVPLTERIKFLVAFRPGLLSPTLAAQMASTYQRMSGGRMLVNVVTGAEPRELHRFGDFADKSTRYERTGEFLAIMRQAWSGEPIDYSGTHYRVEGATTRAVPDPVPEIYFGGASDDAKRVAAEQADVYLVWGEPPEAAAKQRADVEARATEQGRAIRYGIRFHVIARPSAEEAWAAADALLAGISEADIAAARRDFEATMSEGQRRMAQLHGSDTGRLVIHPNVWAGIGLVRGGAGTALVGSYVEVADRLAEYHRYGFDEFILSGYPHLEEAHWVGEGVMPELRQRGLLAGRAVASSPVFSFR